MWNNFKSLFLSIIITKFFIAVLAASVFFMPYLGTMYLDARSADHSFLLELILPLYFCVIPVVTALVCLDRLLARIRRNEVFVQSNIKAIRIISWCCFAICLVTGVSSYFYIPYIFIMMIMLFCGIIVRVIKNVFSKAVVIKDENDFTI